MYKFVVLSLLSLVYTSAFSQTLECKVTVDTYKKNSHFFKDDTYELYSHDESNNLIQYYDSEEEVQAKVGHHINIQIKNNGHVESPISISVNGVGRNNVDRFSSGQQKLVIPIDNKINETFVIERKVVAHQRKRGYYQHKVQVSCQVL